MAKATSLPDGLPALLHLAPHTADDASTLDAAVGPFTVYFPSGFRPGVDAPCTWHSFRHKQREGRHILVARTQTVDFVGDTAAVEFAGKLPCRYAVGRLDKLTGELRYGPLQGIIRMEPRARGLNYEPTAPAPEQLQPLGQAVDAEARKLHNKRLVEQFGSTRRVRQMTAKEMDMVRADAVGGAQAVQGMLAQAGEAAAARGGTKAEVLAAAMAYRNIPPHHPEATTAEHAYRLRELIPGSCWDSLDTERLRKGATDAAYQTNVLAAKRELPGYVISRLELLDLPPGAEKEKKAFRRKARALAWLAALLGLYDGPPVLRARPGHGGITGLAGQRKLPVEVLEAMLQLFYSRSSENDVDVYERSSEQKTLMLMYIFVLALLADNFSLAHSQFEALRQELRMAPSDLAARFRELGATATSTNVKGESATVRQWQVALLPQVPGQPPKTLADSFAKIKLGSRRR